MVLPYEIENSPKHIQDHYKAMIADGQTAAFAEMCALQAPPGTRQTDRAFLQGRQNGEWLDSLPKYQAKRMLDMARKSGINPAGKYYFGGIADNRGPADPGAWGSDASDVKRVAEKRGLDVSGAVEHKAGGRPMKKSKPIADDILRREVAYERSKNPRLSKGEATEKAKDRIVPHWHKGKK